MARPQEHLMSEIGDLAGIRRRRARDLSVDYNAALMTCPPRSYLAVTPDDPSSRRSFWPRACRVRRTEAETEGSGVGGGDEHSPRRSRTSRAGKVNEALGILEKAAASQPGNAALRSYYGQLCFLAGTTIEAEAAFTKALELDSRLTDARNNLGAALRRPGARTWPRSSS